MQKNTSRKILAILLILFVVSAGCSFPIAPAITLTPQEEQPQPTNQLTDIPNINYTNTPQQTTDVVTTLPQPTTTPTITGAISETNATSLHADKPMPIAEWPERLLWPNNSVIISTNPKPVLLLNSGSNLYPVTFAPLAIGSPLAIPLNGAQILAFAPDASSLVVQDSNQVSVITIDGTQLWSITQPSNPYGANFSTDGNFLAVTSSNNWEVSIYDVESGQIIKVLTGFETAAPVYNAIISSGGNSLAYYARATLQFQQVSTGFLGQRISFEDFIDNILFSPDGQRLFLTAAGKLFIFDPLSGIELAQTTLSESVHGLAITPDGSVLVGIYGQSLQFWDANTLVPITLIQPPTSLAKLSISNDGKYIVTCSNENELTVWSIP